MLNYKKTRICIVAIVLIMLVAVCVWLLSNQQSISIPNAKVVQTIEMEQFNESSSLGSVTIADDESIENVLSNLMGSKRTIWSSTNDYPSQNNYLIVRLILDGEHRTLYLYSDSGRYYIEEPYIGIYKSNRDASVAIYKEYTGNTNKEQTLGNLRSANSPLEVNVAEKTTIVPNTPKWSPEQIIGADML